MHIIKAVYVMLGSICKGDSGAHTCIINQKVKTLAPEFGHEELLYLRYKWR